MHYCLSQWKESSTIPHLPNLHHRLLRSVLQQVKTWSPYVDSSPCSLMYPFPSMLLLDPPPVWMVLKPKVSRAALKCAPPPLHQASLPLDPTRQTLIKPTAALLKEGTLETIRTHHTLGTSCNSGDMSHQKTIQHLTPLATKSNVPALTPRPWIHHHRVTCSHLN